MNIKWIFLLSSLVLTSAGSFAAEMQSHADIHQRVSDFIQAQLQNHAGTINIQVGELDTRLTLARCATPEVFLPAGAQLQGKTSLGVRCTEQSNWSVFVPVSISIVMNRLVASKALQQGTTLTASDFNVQAGELNQPGLLTDENLALGKVLKFNLQAGQLLKQDMLREPYLVLQGQTVQIIAERHGISIRGEGKALNNAALGQAVSVKVPSGQLIHGAVGNGGVVEIPQ